MFCFFSFAIVRSVWPFWAACEPSNECNTINSKSRKTLLFSLKSAVGRKGRKAIIPGSKCRKTSWIPPLERVINNTLCFILPFAMLQTKPPLFQFPFSTATPRLLVRHLPFPTVGVHSVTRSAHLIYLIMRTNYMTLWTAKVGKLLLESHWSAVGRKRS
jgi:hypothetical protein